MKKFLLVFLILTGLGYYSYTSGLTKPYLDRYLFFSYCDQPIRYRVDTVDPKFNLTESQFLTDIDQATQIWNKAANRNLFVYDPTKGDLSINMIYDSRQSLSTKINQLEGQLQNNQGSLQSQIDQYNQQSQNFENQIAQLNKEIEDWNAKGGAPPDVYQQLIKKQQDLRAQANQLKQTAQSLNQTTDQYNSQVNRLNQTIDTFNTALTYKPEEGIFKAEQNRIEIYFNISQRELVHTLAHELGHALNLPHNQNPKSIMYPSTTQSSTPSPDDLAALQYACREHNYGEILSSYISQIRTFYGR